MKGDEFFVKIASRPPLNRLHPAVGTFFKDYLRGEKPTAFGDRWVINTHFPPYPGRAFDAMAEQFLHPSDGRRLYSVTLAVTNRCRFRCWHCYNAGRSQTDLPRDALKSLAGELQRLGAALVTVTGGEPLLRDDLEEIVGAFDDRTCVNLNTTGWGLTAARARALKDAGLFAAGVSLDSPDPREHDALRGVEGAFAAAMEALAAARQAGLYPYVVAVARRELLRREAFEALIRAALSGGAREVHLLEPVAIGRLASRDEVLLTAEERRCLVGYQLEAARRDDWPAVSTFAYLEGENAFGCGAGLGHLYIDGSGEVCPCNLVPLSFGNILRRPLEDILGDMGECFGRARPSCVARPLAPHIPDA
ncbi:MAG TPA: hypothetical protein DCX07_03360, partial [Phycisphaerales bacterium]|nr:hypothetical protein [Phycisphaerales bacterium]